MSTQAISGPLAHLGGRGAAIGALALALVAVQVAIVSSEVDRIVPIPIGSHQGPLPIASWASAAAYVALALLVSQGTLSTAGRPRAAQPLAAAIVLGTVLHLTELLTLSLPASLVALSTGPYRAYLLIAVAAYLALLGTWSYRITRNWLSAPSDHRVWQLNGGLFLPVAVVYAWSLGNLAFRGHASLLAAAGSIAAAVAIYFFRGPVSTLAGCWRSALWFPVGLCGLAFAIRALAGLRLINQTGPLFPVASDDGDIYDSLAASLVTGGITGDDPARHWPPGYWTALSLVYRIFGLHNFSAAVLLQAALGAGLALLTFAIAQRVFDDDVARLASVGVALSGTLVFTSATLGTEAIFSPLLALAIWCLLPRPTGSPSLGKVALAGLALGWAELTKPQTMLVIALIALWLLVVGRPKKGQRPWRWLPMLARPATLIVAIALAMSPLIYRDFQLNGHLTILASDGEKTFRATVFGHRMLELGVNPFSDPRGLLEAVAAHPIPVVIAAAEVWPREAMGLFFGFWFGRFDALLLDRLSPYAAAVRLYGYAFGLVGLVAILRSPRLRCDPGVALLAIPLVATTASILVFAEGLLRYRVPLDPYLLMIVALGAVTAARWLAQALAPANDGGRELACWR